MMMRNRIALLAGVLMLGLGSWGYAETVPPEVIVKNTVHDLMTVLKHEKDKKKVLALVDEKVLPLFDFTLLTKRAVGPAWRTATDEQKKVLVGEFRDLLIRLFIARAFTDIGNRSVKFEPKDYAEGDDQVTIKTLIVTPGEASVAIDYDMKKTSAGWKVVDFSLAGPRLALDIYRNQFLEPLQHGGIDGLIKFLGEKNREAEKAVTGVNKAAV